MGKPTAADLKLGLATAPVLFAAQQHPELNTLIMRRFTKKGDVEKAWHYVQQVQNTLIKLNMFVLYHTTHHIRQLGFKIMLGYVSHFWEFLAAMVLAYLIYFTGWEVKLIHLRQYI